MNYFLRRVQQALLILALLVVPSLLRADSTVSISILSILQPKEVTITLRHPDRAMLRAPQSQFVLLAGAPLTIRLQEQKLLAAGTGIMSGFITLHCSGGCLVELQTPGLGPTRKYEGDLKLNVANNTIGIVLYTEHEKLIAPIVASEMGEYRLRSVMEAFAVVVRSYLGAGRRHPELNADFCDLTHCQVFQSFAPTSEAARAVKDTSGLILTYRNSRFRPFYSRSCGGVTATYEEAWGQRSPEYPFTSVQCPCTYSWETSLTFRELAAVTGFPVIRVTQNNAGLQIAGANRESFCTLEEFRTAAGRTFGWKRVQSNSFLIESNKSEFSIHGKGIGHRVGFCQNGAARMAQRGMFFQEILQHYFRNTEIRHEKNGTF